jgi:hypothetical protein
VIRSSIHRTRPFSEFSAGVIMRPGTSWKAVVCLQLEGANYQPKQDRMDSELVI